MISTAGQHDDDLDERNDDQVNHATRAAAARRGRAAAAAAVLPVHFPQHDVDRADERDDVGHQVAAHQPRQRLEVAERRRPHAQPVGAGGLAVARDEVADLALRRLVGVIRLAGRRLDQPRDLAHHRPLGQPAERLPDDPHRLAHLLEPHEIAVVGVALRADRHVELHLGVRRVRLVLAHVARDARAAQRRAAQADGDRVGRRDDADVLRAPEPDPVVREQRLVLDQLLHLDVAELEHLLVPARRQVLREPADAHRVVGQARAAELLEQVEDQLPFAQAVQEHRDRADVHRVAAEPDQVAGQPLQLREDRADVLRAARHLERQQLLDRLDVGRGSPRPTPRSRGGRSAGRSASSRGSR